MNTTNYIRIFRGDDSDALGYQTIVGTIKTDLDLTGCKAVFRFLGFYAEFDPIPEDKKLTIVIPAQASRGFPPGVGYASLKVFDSLGKIRTFTNRIPVIVDTMTPSCGCGEFEVSFSPFPELEPLKIFTGPNADDFDQYTGFISKIIDRASLVKYGLAMLVDEMGVDGGDDGKAASPLAVKAAYDAIIKELTDNYYTADETDDAIERVAAYYITYNTAGAAFPTRADLINAQTYYSGGVVRTPTRNDYAVVLADETHDGAEWRYIYAVADGATTGQWEPQYAVEGVIAYDNTVTPTSANGVKSSGIWSAIWGALSALPTGFASLYDWCVAQLAGKLDKSGGNVTGDIYTNSEIWLTNAGQWTGIVQIDGDGALQSFDRRVNIKALFADIIKTANGSSTHYASRASNPTTGNLAALDSNGNPTDSAIPAADVATNAEVAVADTKATKALADAASADNHAQAAADAAVTAHNAANQAIDAIPYAISTPIVIDTASSEVIEGETVYYGPATLADRTANVVQVTAATALDELRITFPAATSGKVRDFGLRVEIGTGSAALTAPALVPIAPTGETIKIENADGTIPELADGTATAKGVTLLYFSETASGVFVVRGEQVEEVTA